MVIVVVERTNLSGPCREVAVRGGSTVVFSINYYYESFLFTC